MNWIAGRFSKLRDVLIFSLGLMLAGCSGGSTPSNPPPPVEGRMRIGTAPPGGTFNVMGRAIAETLNQHKGRNRWQFIPLATQGSRENILNLISGELEFALANAATSYFATVDGYHVKAIMTMAPNIAMFVTRTDSGIHSITDLAGRRVTMGPEGAGFKMFLLPLLVAHNMYYEDFEQVYCDQSRAVELMAQGEVDAAFLGGAVPTESIVQACKRMDVRFIPFDALPIQVLTDEFVFYNTVTIPGGTYPGQTEPLEALNVGSMHLIASPVAPTNAVYQFTKTIYENRGEIAAKHPAGKAINPEVVTRDTGIDFHPGAVLFYKEIGIWGRDAGKKGQSSAKAP